MPKSFRIVLVLTGLAAAAPAQPPAAVANISIELSNFRFTPANIVLRRGATYRLHFHNIANGAHNFVAPEFFADALAAEDASNVDHGTVALRGGEMKDVVVTPKSAGVFKSHCGHFMHSALGMTGTITVG